MIAMATFLFLLIFIMYMQIKMMRNVEEARDKIVDLDKKKTEFVAFLW